MKHYIRNITWKFQDSSEVYPQLKDRKVKITDPPTLFDNFRFLFDGEVRERFVVFGLIALMWLQALR
ncbi:hypothetical protein C4588_05030 [Candidatus Parcubacteria bacterium]|jgi:hypothetical protein|nr:MAG: hypothetical protein C4588_05030 [Candidatus Parcubacteria bacterium]